MVYAWSGSGTPLWSQALQGAQDFSSPVLVDLTGSGQNDVLVGSATGLFPLDGSTGGFLFGTTKSAAINTCSMQGAPAVADVPGSGPGAGWLSAVTEFPRNRVAPSRNSLIARHGFP